MTNKEVIDYITKTPHNTNPTILKQHLEEQDAELLNNSGAGGLGVQADWNQNDETAPDFVKNRPFYDAGLIHEDECVPEKNFTICDYGNGTGSGAVESNRLLEFDCIVIFDGVEYACERKYIEAGDYSFYGYYYGNPAKRGETLEDTGEPFCMISSYRGYYAVDVYGNSGEHTIQIFKAKRDFVKLDDKFIPASIARVSDIPTPDWDIALDTEPGYIKNRTHGCVAEKKCYHHGGGVSMGYDDIGRYTIFCHIDHRFTKGIVVPEGSEFAGHAFAFTLGEDFKVGDVTYRFVAAWHENPTGDLRLYDFGVDGPLTQHPVTIYSVQEHIKSLGMEYIPDAIKTHGEFIEKTLVSEGSIPMMATQMPEGDFVSLYEFDANEYSNGTYIIEDGIFVHAGVEYRFKWNEPFFIGDNKVSIGYFYYFNGQHNYSCALKIIDGDVRILGPELFKLYRITSEKVIQMPSKFLPKASVVPDAIGETVTAAEFNALLASLRNAGYLET